MPQPAEPAHAGPVRTASPLVEPRRYHPWPAGHAHDHHQLLFGLDGATELEIDGHLYRVDRHNGLIVPAGSHHEFLGLAGNLQVVADFPGASVALPARLMERPRAFALDGALGTRVQALATWRPGGARATHRNWTIAATLAGDLADALGTANGQGAASAFPVMAIDAYLRANLSSALHADHLAARFGWSVRRFHTLFAEAFGDTPHRYQTRLRLDRAVQLLACSGLPLAEVALASGYPDQTTFTRSFTRRFGQPPGAWRASAGSFSPPTPGRG
ncbi:AraC family transcriptional regulator [Cupriavidus sp. WKF15]|uniref:helix-turn-helix transcriptional regulator n=1 Tax=Cupriavidus sp. WKF15 TaxID=3032282 RepID=UPI0023E20735|nr:AraC family transcriptional regulator [Cupriavidus sp. WKF15]WER49171.1 AraC family transcriptional regulator [Cupriavidus sp. WKF15]